ncbi:restriction endonuclease [Acetobacter lambici]|uniref:Restriction endonuclease n=1 Tax=Acetobacter lambici TaxID=1332824 RepID=A0ABT1EY49_9PROT|nr:restriction endonuclease [Acetobacter lambici]MCP1241747.1 restriction endonuclease [Acetobacter lambici]MCP1257872.1 restriction endonuclease [Acetobacter lambici]
MKDKVTSIGIMLFGGAVILGWVLPAHNGTHPAGVNAKAAYAAQAATPVAITGYRPDFSCSADHSKDSIATMLCENSEAARHELIFDQTYYALRQIVGKEGWKSLRQEVMADDAVLGDCLDSTRLVGPQNIPQADPACYIAHMDALTDKYKARLTGVPLEEASRPIDDHIALQQNLIDLGFLTQAQRADGVYGEGTRTAIVKWQQANTSSPADGFISDTDAAHIASMAAGLPPPAGQQQAEPTTQSTGPTSRPNNQSSSSMWLLLLVILVSCGIFYYKKTKNNKRLSETRSLVCDEIFRQKLNLQISRNQKITQDIYGTVKTDLWVREIGYFIQTRIDGLINARISNVKDRQQLRAYAINLVEQVSSDPLPVHVPINSYVSDPTVFDIRMNPFDYELHCALLLKQSGWDAHATQKSGDQGADVIARKGNVRIVVQCKLYSGTVGNDAVQQAFSAQKFQGAQGAIVATNSTFSQSARQAASATGVLLVHHTQLCGAAEELYRHAVQSHPATHDAIDSSS